MKKFYASLAALTLAVSGILLLNFMDGISKAAMPTDCDNNSIIYCGATSASSLASKYKTNKTGDLDNIYHAYGLTDSDLANAGSRAKMGAVHKDGRVTVGSETVATNAKTLGRQNIQPGSTKKVIGGKTYYERTPSVSFRSESIAAFVFFDANGEFKAAVITSCGNPVIAVAKKKPVYTCNSLTANKITRTEYGFNASASAKNGASVTSYNYDFGDGSKTTSSASTIKHTYAQPGTYTAKLSVNVKVGSANKTVTSEKCQVKVTVTPPPVTPKSTCDSLEKTKISRTEYSFDGKASASGGATIDSYTFDFGDGSQKTVTNPSNVTHEYAKEGTYKVKMSVTVKTDGETKTITGENCAVEVTVTPPPETPAFTCDSLEAMKIGELEYSFDGKATATGGAEIVGYTFDFGDGKQQAETNSTGVKHTYDKDGTYKVTMSVTAKVGGENKTATSEQCATEITIVPKECKPGIPVGDERCTPPQECKPGVPMGSPECTPCEIPGKENLPKDSKECVETPVELPHTGPAGLIGSTVGLGSMITAIGYYVASRRGLLSVLLDR